MNPKIVRAKDGTYLLFYTGDTFNSTLPPYNPKSLPMDIQATQRVGMAYASNVTGPFTRVPHPVLDVSCGWKTKDSRSLEKKSHGRRARGRAACVALQLRCPCSLLTCPARRRP